MNFLMPLRAAAAERLLRSEWASRIAQQLRVEEPVLREALRRAAAEATQRGEDASRALRAARRNPRNGDWCRC